MTLITSPRNPRVRAVRALQRRDERDRTGLFLIEGLRVVIEAIQLGEPIEEVVIAPELLLSVEGQRLVQVQRRAGVPCLEVTAPVFDSLASKEGFQGIAAVVRQRWTPLDAVDLTRQPWWVALVEVGYPGNLGTVLRTCDAAGAAGVLLVGRTADPYDRAAVRASTGALFAQQLVRTSVAEFMAWKRRRHVRVVGTSATATIEHRALTYRPPLVLMMGSERQGLTAEQRGLCDELVRIPMVGRSDSLNLGVATGILLYEVFNQRHPRSSPSGE